MRIAKFIPLSCVFKTCHNQEYRQVTGGVGKVKAGLKRCQEGQEAHQRKVCVSLGVSTGERSDRPCSVSRDCVLRRTGQEAGDAAARSPGEAGGGWEPRNVSARGCLPQLAKSKQINKPN